MLLFLKKHIRAIYTIPLIYATIFILFAVLFNYLDRVLLFNDNDLFFVSTYTYGHELFLLMIGSLITLITISISLMMVVLTVYGAQFSPRTLQDFLSSKKTLHILGILIGTLIYSILSFFLLNRLSNVSFIISPLLGTLLFIFSIFVFVYFIRFVSQSVQINLYVQKLSQEIIKDINAKEATILEDDNIHFKKDVILKDLFSEEAINILSTTSGYLRNYDNVKIVNLARDNDIVVLSKKQIGEYVFEEDVIFEIYNKKDLSEDLQQKLIESLDIQQESVLYNSLGFGTKKITEIALRAMSKSTNDSATASFCIEQLGESLKGITTILAHVVYTDETKQIRLIAHREYFTRVLYDHFAQIKEYGFNDLMIVKSTLSAFVKIATKAEDNQNNDLWEFTTYMLGNIAVKDLHTYDYEYIISDLYHIALLTKNIDEFKKVYKK